MFHDTFPVVIAPATAVAECITLPVVMAHLLVTLVVLVQEAHVLRGEPGLGTSLTSTRASAIVVITNTTMASVIMRFGDTLSVSIGHIGGKFERVEVLVMVLLEPGPVAPVLAHVFYSHHQASIEVQHSLHGGKHAIARDEVKMSEHVHNIRLSCCIIQF